MDDGTEYALATTEWFAELKSDKTAPPKKEFQVQHNLKFKKDKDPMEYGVTIGYQITQDMETDNSLAMVFNFKTDEVAKVTDYQYVVQFLRYRKKGDFGQYRFVTCGTKFNDEAANVNNFNTFTGDVSKMTDIAYGTSSFSDPSTQKFWDNKLWDDVTAEGHFFHASEEKNAQYLKKEGAEVKAQCIAILNIPKFNDGSSNFIGEDILGDYDVQIGLVIQNHGAAPTTRLTYTNKKTMHIKAP